MFSRHQRGNSNSRRLAPVVARPIGQRCVVASPPARRGCSRRLLLYPKQAHSLLFTPVHNPALVSSPFSIYTENSTATRHCQAPPPTEIHAAPLTVLQFTPPLAPTHIHKPVLAISRQARASPSIADEPLPRANDPARGPTSPELLFIEPEQCEFLLPPLMLSRS